MGDSSRCYYLDNYPVFEALCRLHSSKNIACSISGLDVLKSIAYPYFVLLARAVFFCLSFVFLTYVVFCLLVFGCQYQCHSLHGLSTRQPRQSTPKVKVLLELIAS